MMKSTAPGGVAEEALLQVRGASRSFGGLRAVNDVSFSVGARQVVGVIGPNGAGKSTLFNLVTGLLALSSGEVRFESQSLTFIPAHKRIRLGMARTFQIVRLFSELTVLENVMLGSHYELDRGLFRSLFTVRKVLKSEAEVARQAYEALEFVGLAHRASDSAAHLPHGQQRMVEIARALIAKPRLLLLDEPAAGLNGTETEHLLRLLSTLRDQHMSILVVEHDMNFVMSLCDSIVVMNQGAKLCEGTPEHVRSDPMVIEAYLGKGRSNAAS